MHECVYVCYHLSALFVYAIHELVLAVKCGGPLGPCGQMVDSPLFS